MIGAAEMLAMQQRTGALLVLASAVAFGVMPIFGKLCFEAGVGVAHAAVRPLRDRHAGAVGRGRRSRRAAARRRPRRRAAGARAGRGRLRDAVRPVLPRAGADGRVASCP